MGDTPKTLVGVGGPFTKTLTLFKTKICDFCRPIYDLTYMYMTPSKGGSLVALSHPSVYLCRLTSGGNCRCRFSVQIHMSLSLQKFVSDVSLR